MTASIGAAELGRFRAAIARRLGLSFDDTKLGFLADVLQRRVDASGNGTGLYLDHMEGRAPLRDELRELAQELTVAETYFFRHLEQFRAFAEVALPDRISARSAVRQIRILSAGCASGEEAYSLAILVRERALDPGWEVSIRAVDVNAAMLERAARARYSAWSLRETPAEIQRRWFHAGGREFMLERSIQAAVAFEERNLAHDNADLWQPDSYDVVFCRNVIMYFTPENAQALISRITTALAPGGYLFLGHAETLRGLSQDFHLRHTHGTFYYERKDSLEHAPAVAVPWEDWRHVPASPPADLGWATTWIETVQGAAERIQALTERTPVSEVGPSGPAVMVRRGAELSVALELLTKERFAEALDLLEDLPPDSAQDPDVLLLRAVLLTHGGQVAAAERVCAQLLELDELNAGAHYVLALCREGAGDRQGALDQDQVAVYLDPTFAMPRLHLGLMARRAGDREAARRELAQAILLLQREDASRLLLFGGGFSREALTALCRAELATSGGKQ